MRLRQTIGFSLVLLLVSGGAMAKTAAPDPGEPRPAAKKHLAAGKAKPEKITPSRQHIRARPEARTVAGPHESRRRAMRRLAADRPIHAVHAIGTRETGNASWYGGRHIGRRTASGKPLDRVHPTAAHRTLPLHSLARVTNLNNGRSCIVEVTDRGPTSRRLLIDLSPRAADELAMRDVGIVPVTVEPVAPVADTPD